MERRTRKQKSSGKPYCKWSEEEKLKLLKIRIELDHIFTSKNANMNEGWRLVGERFGDPQKDYKSCRQAWKNIAQKYKAVGIQQTGDGTGDDAPSTRDEFEECPVFALSKKFAEKKHNYHPPNVLESSAGAVALALPSPEDTNESDQTPSPSFSSSTVFTYPSSASPTSSIKLSLL